jgi:uncharacterized protein YndB with AHSA1/START domain
MPHIVFNRRINAPIDVVWSLLEDHRGMQRWTPLRRAELEREGSPAPNGVGAIRKLVAVGPPIREEVTEYQAPTRLVYKMLSGAPVENYFGRTTLTDREGATDLYWTIDFDSKVPGVGLVIKGVIGDLIRRLARESEKRSR